MKSHRRFARPNLAMPGMESIGTSDIMVPGRSYRSLKRRQKLARVSRTPLCRSMTRLLQWWALACWPSVAMGLLQRRQKASQTGSARARRPAMTKALEGRRYRRFEIGARKTSIEVDSEVAVLTNFSNSVASACISAEYSFQILSVNSW